MVSATTLSILMEQDKALSFSEIVEKTGYAKSHVSYALRLLEEKGLVERVSMKRKKVFFKARSDAIKKVLVKHLSEIEALLAKSRFEECRNIEVCNQVEEVLSEINSILRRIRGENV